MTVNQAASQEPEWVKEVKGLADFSGILLPEQTYATPASSPRRLALAVLKWAIKDLLTYTGVEYSRRTKTYAREDSYQSAWNWVFRSEEASWVYPFEDVCALLGIEPDWFRDKLKMLLANNVRPIYSFRDQARGSRHSVRQRRNCD